MIKSKRFLSIVTKGPLVGLLLLWFVDVEAQQVQFKEPLRQSIRTYQIIEDQGEYYSVGQSYNSVINRYGIVLLKLDSLGKTVKSKEILDSFFFSNFCNCWIGI